MGFSMTHRMTPEEVVNPQTFGSYCQQELGIPYPSGTGLRTLSSVAKDYFERNPKANWQTLCKVVAYCKSGRRRPAHAWAVLEFTRYAFSAGMLPELIPADVVDEAMETKITDALSVEQDPDWVRRLTSSFGPGREEVLTAWTRLRAPTLTAH